MNSRRWSLRCAALLAGGALAVHELRYAVAYRDHAREALAQQGHAYLALLTPLVIGLAVLALAAWGHTLARGTATCAARDVASLPRLWALAFAALFAIHFGQETLEGWLAAGHPAGVAGTFAHGGIVAIALCVAVGALVALALRGADATAQLARTGHRARPRLRLRRPTSLGTARPHARPALALLTPSLAARAPPAAFV